MLLQHLTQQERQVIEWRYQIGPKAVYGVEEIPRPYTEVARRLGRTTDFVKTVEGRALMKLRYWAQRGRLLTASEYI